LAVVLRFDARARTPIATLSLHDALPIFGRAEEEESGGDTGCCTSGAAAVTMTSNHDDDSEPRVRRMGPAAAGCPSPAVNRPQPEDRKSTRLNSSHVSISYAVFCLKTKKE